MTTIIVSSFDVYCKVKQYSQVRIKFIKTRIINNVSQKATLITQEGDRKRNLYFCPCSLSYYLRTYAQKNSYSSFIMVTNITHLMTRIPIISLLLKQKEQYKRQYAQNYKNERWNFFRGEPLPFNAFKIHCLSPYHEKWLKYECYKLCIHIAFHMAGHRILENLIKPYLPYHQVWITVHTIGSSGISLVQLETPMENVNVTQLVY